MWNEAGQRNGEIKDIKGTRSAAFPISVLRFGNEMTELSVNLPASLDFVSVADTPRGGQSPEADVPESHSSTSIHQHCSIFTGSMFYLHTAALYLPLFTFIHHSTSLTD